MRKWLRLLIVLVVVLALDAVAFGVYGVFGHDATMKTASSMDIDQYPKQTRVTGCLKPMGPRPGVADFRYLIMSQLEGRDDGLAGCKKIANSSGAYSDHADGRAWDWHAVAKNPADIARVGLVLNWLLRTDERGNRNAMARRLGMTYIIWNHQFYRVGSDQAHWVPYTGTADPHDTHVHFSFSVAGADRRTSWWTERGPLLWTFNDAAAQGPMLYGDGAQVPLAGDWDGDGRDTVGIYNPADRRFSLRDTLAAGQPTATTPPVGAFGAMPFAGDWNGDGVDEVGVYEPIGRRFMFFTLAGAEARPAQIFGADGDLPIIGDWDGDGVDDIGSYSPARRTYSRLLADGTSRTDSFGNAGDTPLAGDWDGDRRDDLGVFRKSNHTFLLSGADGHSVRSVRLSTSRHRPVVGDWDGDGTDEEGTVATT
jgi:hypothetical protein